MGVLSFRKLTHMILCSDVIFLAAGGKVLSYRIHIIQGDQTF